MTTEEQAAISKDQKHTSNVAKIHYQKLSSRQVAQNSKNLVEKLKTNTSSMDMLQTIAKSTIPLETLNEVTPVYENGKEVLVKSNSNLPAISEKVYEVSSEKQVKKPKRAAKVPFSSMEDKYIKEGILKYGQKWTNILNDPDYLFHPSRKAPTLLTRAKICKFI